MDQMRTTYWRELRRKEEEKIESLGNWMQVRPVRDWLSWLFLPLENATTNLTPGTFWMWGDNVPLRQYAIGTVCHSKVALRALG